MAARLQDQLRRGAAGVSRRTVPLLSVAVAAVACWPQIACDRALAQATQRYRLSSVDLKQRIIWGAECRGPEGGGLAFGGQDQDAEDGRPHTRVLESGQWRAVHQELQAANPLQPFYDRAWALRNQAKNVRARARHVYFEGRPEREEAAFLQDEVAPRQASLTEQLESLAGELAKADGDEYARGQIRFALDHLKLAKARLAPDSGRLNAEAIKRWREAQIHLELAAEALDAEPPPRAIDCGPPRKQGETSAPPPGIVYDAKTRLYLIFGGDHLDYLTNDTWLFDPAEGKWLQRHPQAAPPPRANHRLEALGGGKVRMTGGYTYTSNTDYCGGQYADLDDGEWIYDVESNTWSGGRPVAPDRRVYRTGPFHPDYYLQGDRPDAAVFQAWLSRLPVNRWVPTDPPFRPRLNRDWGTARIDPDRDLMLRWSGGHSAHGGTDVLHFHFATNRWELPFPVEFPLGQLYSNTSYPRGPNFNLRPWMTGHTYQNYAYDPPSKKLIKAGRPRHYYLYDPDVADWIGRGEKPPAMTYNSCFYDLTLVATPHGTVCWGKNGRVCLFGGKPPGWTELELSGDGLPGACVDNSTIAYDGRRDRVLMLRKPYGKDPYDGQVYALDMRTHAVGALSPGAAEQAHTFAYIDRCCYDAEHDLVLMATYLSERGGQTPTPAYDCAENRWILLDVQYQLGERYGRTVRVFPHGRSCGIMFDPQRKLIWGTDTNSQVYVLRLDPEAARARPLGQ